MRATGPGADGEPFQSSPSSALALAIEYGRRKTCLPFICRSSVLLATIALAAGAGPRQPPVSDSRSAVVIRDVTVVDVVARTLRPHSSVTVIGERIAGVEPASATVPKGAQVIDGRAKFLIPGLWDMHSHSLWSEEAMRTFLPLYVAAGVTGIRDMGGRLPILAAYRDSYAAGLSPWPRAIAAGEVLDGPQPVQADISIPVSDEASAVAAVVSLAAAGLDFIKVYTLLSKEAYSGVLSEARRLGLPVAGHVPASITPEEEARAGKRSIEHLRDEIDDDLAPLRPLDQRLRSWATIAAVQAPRWQAARRTRCEDIGEEAQRNQR